MDYEGVIIEESLANKTVLDNLRTRKTKVDPVTEKHKTPWLRQWTLRTVSIEIDRADKVAEELSRSLDYSHGCAWYADFKNDKTHYIIFKDKIFKIDRTKEVEYQVATDYGVSLGIPSYQVDFAPNVIKWKR